MRCAGGIAGLITPWNLPLYLLSFKVAPAIAAGCCVVVKPSEITSVTAWMLCEAFQQAGNYIKLRSLVVVIKENDMLESNFSSNFSPVSVYDYETIYTLRSLEIEILNISRIILYTSVHHIFAILRAIVCNRASRSHQKLRSKHH